MLSVIGEEYISYSESVKGQYTPMVAIQKYDGTVGYREIIKEDLLRIKDEQTLPGGWLFRKSQNTSSSWVKRFALLRGSFMFFFHSPQNEKPIAVVPLDECIIISPDNGHKTFDEMRSYKANEGFEFDIRHNTRSTVRLYTLSEQERYDWINSCNERIKQSAINKSLESNASVNIPSTGGMVVTTTKLTGLSLLPTATTSSHSSNSNNNGYNNLPPLPKEPYPTSTTYSTAATYTNYEGSLSNQSVYTTTNTTTYRGGGSNTSSINQNTNRNSNLGSFYTPTPTRPAIYEQNSTTNTTTTPNTNKTIAPYQNPQKTTQVIGLNKFRTRKDLGFEFVLLEENLKKKLSEQLEARNREASAKNK